MSHAILKKQSVHAVYLVIIMLFGQVFYSEALAGTWYGKKDSAGKQHGKWIQKINKGRVVEILHFHHGVTNGPWQAFYHSGRKKFETHNRDGQLSGPWISYYDNKNNTIKNKGTHERGKAQGVWTTWHPDGKTIKSVENYLHGNKHGSAEHFFYTGNRNYTTNFKDGLHHGQYTSYYNNVDNTKKSAGEHVRNKANGVWVYWHANGKTVSEKISYRLGTKHGQALSWYASGGKKIFTHYKDGNHHGEYESWYDNADNTMKSKGKHVDNRATGKWTYWHADGKTVSAKIDYQHGEKHGRSEDFYASGNKKVVTSYQRGLHHGDYTAYYDNSDNIQKNQGNYVKHKAEGAWTYWHANGQKSASGNYRKGERNGTWQFWSDTGQLTKTMSYNNGKGRVIKNK